MSNEDLKFIAERLTFEFYNPGEILFHEGQEGDQLYIIIKGSVSVLIPHQTGFEYTSRRSHTPGKQSIGTGDALSPRKSDNSDKIFVT